jgi:hypothetical protein
VNCPQCDGDLTGLDRCPRCQPPQAESAASPTENSGEPSRSASSSELLQNAGAQTAAAAEQLPNPSAPQPEPDEEPSPPVPSAKEQAAKENTEIPKQNTEAPKQNAEAPKLSVKAPKQKPLIETTDTRAGTLLAIDGHGNNVWIKHVDGRSEDTTPRRTIFDFLIEFSPSSSSGEVQFDVLELTAAVENMHRERLLFIVCSDTQLARPAAEALLARSTIAKRRLHLDDLPEAITPEVKTLLPRRGSRRPEMLLLINASQGVRAQRFVDSLFTDPLYGKDDIKHGLEQARITVACLTSSKLIANTAGMAYPRWDVSAVRLLLQKTRPSDYAALEAEIAAQRKAGKWPSTDSEFQQQVEDLIARDELETVVRKGGPLTGETGNTAPEGMINDSSDPLDVAVLYVATYYIDLSQNEFASIVELVVGEQTAKVPEEVRQRSAAGSFRVIQVKRDKPVIDFWKENPDAILRRCGLKTSRDAGRPVIFADIGRRDLLLGHFEEQYGAYVRRQFLRAWDKLLLFGESDRIAAAFMQVVLDTAAADTSQFDAGWFVDTMIKSGAAAADGTRAFRRTAALLRRMLEHPVLSASVTGVLDVLLHRGEAQLAFALVRQLRFAPQFDALYWLQQLLDRGGALVREPVRQFLYSELERAGVGVHRYVALLEEKWLPPAGCDPRSPSSQASLLTLFVYCFQATAEFDVESYGAWPCRFPILGAERSDLPNLFTTLFRCLFHPALLRIADVGWTEEELTHEVAMLISKWVFILYGVVGRLPETEDNGSYGFSRDDVLTTLLEQLLEVTKSPEKRLLRARLIAEWEWAKDIYLRAPSELGDLGYRRRDEFAGKRRLVHRLISEFRRLQRARHDPPVPRNASGGNAPQSEGAFMNMQGEELP